MATWYGVRDNGEKVQIEHSKLMEWAYANDMPFQVG